MKKTIFVIDDDADVRDVIVFALENEDFQVIPAENGRRGLELLRDLPPDRYPGLIIVDYLMPELNGKDLIRILKTEHADTLGKIPIIMSSAMGNVGSDEEADFEGVTRLYKPMDLDDLLTLAYRFCS